MITAALGMSTEPRTDKQAEEFHLELGQKIGIAILMVIPAILGSVWLGDVGHWILSIIWLILMPFLYKAIITGKIHAQYRKLFS